MSAIRKQAYIAVDEPVDLHPLVLSLQEQGFDFNAPPQMQPWFGNHNIPVTVKPVLEAIAELSAGEKNALEQTLHLFVVHMSAARQDVYTAQREALTSFLMTLPHPHILLVTEPGQYQFLQPEVLQNASHWPLLSRQLMQDVKPYGMLRCMQTQVGNDEKRRLYSSNPVWAQSLEILLPQPAESGLSPAQLHNLLGGSYLLVHMARTMGLNPHQAILMQHGLPVQAVCNPQSIREAVTQAVFKNSVLTPGGTLVVSEALDDETCRIIDEVGIQTVLSTSWDAALLSGFRHRFTPVAFHLERLQISHTMLEQLNASTLQVQSDAIDARQVMWHTTHKPGEKQRMDLEMGVVIAESLPQCGAVFVKNQSTLAVASGMAVPLEAVDYCLNREAGETKDAVCVLTGEVFTQQVFDALIQARVAGVLFLSPVSIPAQVLDSFKNTPFFVGHYTEDGVSHLLQQVGVRHG